MIILMILLFIILAAGAIGASMQESWAEAILYLIFSLICLWIIYLNSLTYEASPEAIDKVAALIEEYPAAKELFEREKLGENNG